MKDELKEAYEADVAAAQAAKQAVVDLANANIKFQSSQRHHESTTAKVRELIEKFGTLTHPDPVEGVNVQPAPEKAPS